MRIIFKIGFLISLFWGTSALAEGNCPAGMYPIGGGNAGWVGCAPIPGYDSGQGQDNGPRGHWEDSYGTLVLGDAEDGTLRYSYSYNYENKKKAINRALNECKNGGIKNCREEVTFWNSYLVVVDGENGYIYWGHDENEGNAKELALAECQKANKDCRVLKTIDSRAVWVN